MSNPTTTWPLVPAPRSARWLPQGMLSALATAAWAVIALTSAPHPAGATTWLAASPGDLLADSNWTDGVAPNGTGQIAEFAAQPTNVGNFALNGSMTLSSIIYSNSLARSITGGGTLTLDVVSGTPEISVTGGALTIGATISGSQGLTKSGASMLTLTGSSNYTGTTAIDGGTLQFAKTTSMPSVDGIAVNAGSTLAVNAGGAGAWTNGTSGGGTIGGLIAGVGGQGTANQITWNSGGFLGINTQAAPGGALTYGGVIGAFRSGAGTTRNDVGLAKVGAGTLKLSGNNTYSGGTIISSGTLQFVKAMSMPSSGGVTVMNSQGLAVNVGGAGEWTNGLSGGGTIGGLIAGAGGQGTLNQVTWNSGSRLAIDTTNTLGNSITYGGDIGNFRSGAGTTRDDVGLDKFGFGILKLAGTNSYSGSTNIVGDTPGNTLQFAKTTAMPAAAPVSVGSLATLAVNVGGAGEWTNGASGGGSIGGLIAGIGGQGAVGQIAWDSSVSALGIDTTNAPGGTFTYSGTIGNFNNGFGSTTNNVRLTKLGSGTLALTGANIYTGGTVVGAGTLLANNTSGSGTGTGNINVTGGTLGGTGTIGGSMAISNGGRLAPGAGAGTLFATGGADLAGGAILNYDLANSTTVGGGINDLLSVTGNLSLGGSLSLNINALQGDLATGIYKLITYTGGLIGNASGLNIVSNNTTNSHVYSFSSATPGEIQLIVADPIPVNTWSGITSASWDAGSNWSTSAKPTSATDVVFPTPAPATGATISLTTGEIARALTINDNYTLSGGDLNVSTGIVNVATGKTASVGSVLAGSAGLTKAGAGTLVLTSSNTYTGGTVISAGVLRIGNGGALGAGNTSIGSGATLNFNRSDIAYSYAGAISGNGSLDKDGASKLTLSGSNSYTGLTSIHGGTLQFAKTSAMTAPAPLSVSNGATLAVNVGGAGEWTSGSSGGGSLGGLIAGTGGQGTVDQVLWASGSILGIDTTNAPGGTFTYAGTIGNFHSFGSPTNNIGLTKVGLGTLALTGTSTYSGRTIVNGGELSVTNGGAVTANEFVFVGYDPGSNGTLSVGGGSGSSTWTTKGSAFYVAYAGTGTMNVTGGGAVSTDLAFIGEIAGSNGTVNVGGGTETSTWTNTQDLHVGSSSNTIGGITGTMNITGGGEVYSGLGIIGGAGSSGAVNVGGGAGSSNWTASAPIYVGSVGTGAMSVAGGGTVSSSAGYIGSSIGSSGIVNVGGGTGTSSWSTNGGDLFVGDSGAGTMNISGGGTVSSGSAYLGRSAILSGGSIVTGRGTVSVGGGAGSATWAIAGSLTIGSDLTTGTLDIKSNGLVSTTGPVTFGSLGTLSGTGTIAGNVSNGGRVAPGNSPGIITINGDYAQSANGELEIEVASYSGAPGTPDWIPGTDHDQLVVSGTATLGGRLDVPVIDPLRSAGGPALGLPPIDFLTAGSVVGEFSAIVAPGLDEINPNLTVDVQYITSGPNQGARLSFVPTKTNVVFDDATNTTADWFNSVTTWEDTANPGNPIVPALVNDISIENLTATAQTVEVESANALVARLTVGGGTDDLTVMVGDGTSSATSGNLSSTLGVTVESHGVIALNAGTLATADLTVDGGTLKGNGLVDLSSKTSVGTGTLSVANGVISPGFSVGHLNIDGNLELATAAEVVIEVDGDAQFDTIDLTGEAALGGTLTVDLTGATLSGRGEHAIITAGSLTPGAEFDSIEVVGNDDFAFRVEYDQAETGLAAAPARVRLLREWLGDMSGDGALTAADVQPFALALSNPDQWQLIYGDPFGIDLGTNANCDKKGGVDFDDIDDFVKKLNEQAPGSITMALMIRAIRDAQRVPEPGSLMLAVMVGCSFHCRRQRLAHRHA